MKNINFRNIIDDALFPLMRERCVMLNLPYYPNPGDCMIWMGMEQFMHRHGIECIYRSSAETFLYRPLTDDVVICFVGGGNFGDVWNEEEQLVCKVSQLYPKNRIVVFPQSVHYCDEKRLLSESAILSLHSDLHICARDKASYKLLNLHFSQNNILLVPDMALYLHFSHVPSVNEKRNLLFLKREDKEAVDYNCWSINNADITDWPMMDLTKINVQNNILSNRMRHWFLRHLGKFINEKNVIFIYRLCSIKFLKAIENKSCPIDERWLNVLAELWYIEYLAKTKTTNFIMMLDWFAYKFFMPIQVQYAAQYINQYKRVITTRLHGGILAFLLQKEVDFIDNSYGKISAIVDLWLSNFTNVRMMRVNS